MRGWVPVSTGDDGEQRVRAVLIEPYVSRPGRVNLE